MHLPRRLKIGAAVDVLLAGTLAGQIAGNWLIGLAAGAVAAIAAYVL